MKYSTYTKVYENVQLSNQETERSNAPQSLPLRDWICSCKYYTNLFL